VRAVGVYQRSVTYPYAFARRLLFFIQIRE
jgi:hypothetical protein